MRHCLGSVQRLVPQFRVALLSESLGRAVHVPPQRSGATMPDASFSVTEFAFVSRFRQDRRAAHFAQNLLAIMFFVIRPGRQLCRRLSHFVCCEAEAADAAGPSTTPSPNTVRQNLEIASYPSAMQRFFHGFRSLYGGWAKAATRACAGRTLKKIALCVAAVVQTKTVTTAEWATVLPCSFAPPRRLTECRNQEWAALRTPGARSAAARQALRRARSRAGAHRTPRPRPRPRAAARRPPGGAPG